MIAARPAHAYVPGRTPRHPEGAFDAIRSSVRPGMDAAALARSAAFRTGLRYLDDAYHWEAHELLEPVWMALPEGADRRFVQGLIQLANGLLKLRMGRPKAAARLAGIAEALLGGQEERVMGVDRYEMLERCALLRRNAKYAL